MNEHIMKLSNREALELTGVNNVNLFDEGEVILETQLGHLLIKGQDLHITMLSLEEGKVSLEGMINILEYKAAGTDIKAKGKNILTRLLK
ncbi:MAG: sporulation protein YabP [Syntrophomonadaceae bacterium]|jgi:sporulation protein YabP|nr:sporulation protein YabP [Syntrophomonadaceae bacterium]